MGMTLKDRVSAVKAAISGDQGKLPFVHVVGHQKVQGKMAPRDFNKMIANYKSWPFACANKNAYSVAMVNMNLFKASYTKEGKQLEQIYNHPFLDLMRNVNPFFNNFELKTLLILFLDLTGNAYWWIVKDQLGVPRMIWNIPSNWMKPVPSETEFIAGYVLRVPNSGKDIPFPEDEIIHFKYPSPFDLFYGTGPMIASDWSVDLNRHMKQYGINFFGNNAQPGGVLETENALTEEQFKRLKDQWNLKYQGSGNAGKLAILEKGLKYNKLGSTLKDLQYKDINRPVRDEILAIFGVPPSKLGLVEDVNRANADANDYTYQKETVKPKLLTVEEKINEKLMPMYDPALEAHFEENVPSDKDFRLREQESHIKSGYSSIDDEREKDREEPYSTPETQSPLIPFNVIPAGTEAPKKEAGKEPAKAKAIQEKKEKSAKKWRAFATLTRPQEKIFETKIRRFFEAQHSEAIRKLNALKGVKNEKAGVDVRLLLNLEEQTEKLKISSGPNVKEAFIGGANLGMAETGFDFDLIAPNVTRAVNHRINFFASKVNESTVSLLKDTLNAGFEAGESVADISKRVDNIFNFSEKFRAKRIAQTEVIGATNEGQLFSYVEAGVENKEWLTALDEKVRDSHQIDGQQVGISETFVTRDGNRLLHPGDRSTGAPAGEVINCRCTVSPVIE